MGLILAYIICVVGGFMAYNLVINEHYFYTICVLVGILVSGLWAVTRI